MIRNIIIGVVLNEIIRSAREKLIFAMQKNIEYVIKETKKLFSFSSSLWVKFAINENIKPTDKRIYNSILSPPPFP